jgi:hypothetical protein
MYVLEVFCGFNKLKVRKGILYILNARAPGSEIIT